jgi:hypothetical protein
MWFWIAVVALCAAVAMEYRLRRPDQLILVEKGGSIAFRKFRWYPRHFSLAIPAVTHPMEMKVEASAKGSMPVIIRIAASVAASRQAIGALIRVGGWNSGAVGKAAKELETLLQAMVRRPSQGADREDAD